MTMGSEVCVRTSNHYSRWSCRCSRSCIMLSAARINLSVESAGLDSARVLLVACIHS